MEDRIEKQIELKAPLSRVWQALTDYRQFGEWFGVKLEGPFVPGQKLRGQIDNEKCGQITMEIAVQKIEPERLFTYTWHPYAIDMKKDYSHETPTLVEFKLKENSGGTLLTVIESGFSKVPSDRRDEAFRMHENGWTEQLKNIEKFIAKDSSYSKV